MPERRSSRGFTLLEVLIAAFILSIILGALFVTLNISQTTYALNSARVGLQAELKGVMDIVAKDLRQAFCSNINSVGYGPSITHLKFNLWSWDEVSKSRIVSAAYIEYNYDPALKILTRTLVDAAGITTSVLKFYNITEAPFYTTYSGPGSPGNEFILNCSIHQLAVIIVVISGEKDIIKDGLKAQYSLNSRVGIRNI